MVIRHTGSKISQNWVQILVLLINYVTLSEGLILIKQQFHHHL